MDLLAHLKSYLEPDYVIERELGGGGMSRVFVATESRLGRRVVIKVLLPELSASLSAERFEREIQLAASLQQANIVPLLTAGHVGEHPYFTMPFVEGESLRVRLTRGALSETETLSILRDVARALVYAHEHGVVHRDIKPDNVLLSGEAAVVTDFGIAKAINAARTNVGADATGAMTQLGTAIGTPAYMAPEQAAGDPATDHRADIYAIGCLAFELLTGEPPFAGRPPHKLMIAHMSEEAPRVGARREGVGGVLEELIARCLAKAPEDRPATAREVLRLLEVAVSGVSRDALPTALSGRQWRLSQALGVWAATFGATWVLAKAAVVGIGLPSWTVPLALVVSAFGLPAVVVTWWVQQSARRVLLRTPQRTPGGSAVVSTMATLAVRASPHVSWSRTWRAGVLSGAGVVLAIVVVMVLRAFGIGPAASLLAAGRVGVDSRVLVAEFTTSVADTSLGDVVAQAMRTSLAQSNAVRLVSGSSIAAALGRMTLPLSARITEETAREMAVRDGIALIVTGHIAAAGGGFLLTARLIAADSGIELASVQRGANGAGDLLDAIDQLARDLRSRIGESLRTVQGAPRLENATTSSLAALREYSRAIQLGDVQGDFAGAIPYLESALREDSTFAEAWRKLGVFRFNIAAPMSSQFAAVSAAYRFRARLTGAERGLVEAYYENEINTRRALALYAADADISQNNHAVLLRTIGDYAGAERVVRVAMAAGDERGIIQLPTNLVAALLGQGKVAEAREVAAQMRRDYPGAYYTELVASWVSWTAGGVDSLAAAADTMRRSLNQLSRSEAANFAVAVAGARGQLKRYADLAQVSRALSDSARGAGLETTVAALDVIVATAVHRGQAAAGVRAVDSVLAANPMDRVPPVDQVGLHIATAYAQLGQPARARPLLADFLRNASREDRLLRWDVLQVAQGEIALAEGRADAALPLFRAATLADSGHLERVDLGRFAVRRARAFDAAGQPDSAIAAFESYRAREGMVVSYALAPLALPATLRRLGELYAARGEIATAIARYEEFVALWKDADPDLQPQVAEIRRRLRSLRDAEARQR